MKDISLLDTILNTKKNKKKNININKNIKKILKTSEEFKDTFKDGVDGIKEGFYSLKEIGRSLKSIGNMFVSLGKILGWLFKFVIYILGEVLNPFNLFKDLYSGFVALPRVLINVTIRIITTFSKYMVNNILNPIMNNVFGWNNKNRKNMENDKDKKCYKTDEGKIPLSVIVSTIILPPLGVFMRFGLSKWMDILIAGALSIIYYFPGLIYALVLIYTY